MLLTLIQLHSNHSFQKYCVIYFHQILDDGPTYETYRHTWDIQQYFLPDSLEAVTECEHEKITDDQGEENR